jgi:uncharacterized protein (PEP-CTERM system associated)
MVGAPAAAYYRRAALGLISVSGLVYGTVAHAGDWTITPKLSVSEAFTDNSGLNSDNEDRNSDFTTLVSPGLSISGTGGRSSLNLNYNFNRTFYHRKTQADENRNALAANGQVELWKRIFFVDGQAAISQVIEDGTQAAANSPTGQNVNRTEARSFNVSPFLRQHFGQWLETEPRVTYNKTTTESDLVEDTTTRTATFTVNGGRRFALFPWSIVALDRKTQNDGAQPSEQERRVDGSFSYVLDRKLTLTGGVGWEDIQDPGLNDQSKGITWSGGFTARPSSRTSLQFSYGDRNGDSNISASASHRLSARTSVIASFNESIQTSQSLIAQQLLNLTTDPNAGGVPVLVNGSPLLDPVSGDPVFGVTSTQLGLSESTFRQQIFRLNFNGTRQRNTFNGGGFWEERVTESTGIKETNYGGNLSVRRRLSSRLNGNVGIAVQKTDFGTADKREEIDYNGSTSLSYQVRNDIHLTLTKVNNAPDDLLENSVSVGLTKSF